MKTRIEHVRLDELHPKYQMFARIIGIEAAVKLGQDFAGSQIYFPLDELHPFYGWLTDLIGYDAAVKLRQEFGRASIHFPHLIALTPSRRRTRDNKIARDYESGEYTKEQLGRKYRLTTTGIIRVLKKTLPMKPITASVKSEHLQNPLKEEKHNAETEVE